MFSDMLQSIIDFFLYLPRQIIAWITDAIASLVESIPAPIDASQVQSALNGIGGDVLFWAGVAEMDYGIQVVLGAYVGKFLLKLVPGI